MAGAICGENQQGDVWKDTMEVPAMHGNSPSTEDRFHQWNGMETWLSHSSLVLDGSSPILVPRSPLPRVFVLVSDLTIPASP